MAKKKKKTKGKAGSGDDKGSTPEQLVSDLNLQLELQKGEFAIQQRSQEERIKLLEEKLEEEKERNLELRLRLEQTVRQKWDLFEGSEIANADKDSKLKRLQETNARLTEELNYLRANLEDHKKEIERQAQLEHEKLENEINRVSTELVRFRDYQIERSQMLQEIEELKAQVQDLEFEMHEKLQKAHSRHEEKQHELREQMVQKLMEKKSEMIKLTDQAVGTKARKALQQNEDLKKEISIHSMETARMLKLNQQLQEENSDLHRARNIIEDNFNALLKKSIAQQQTIKILTKKLNNVESAFQSYKARTEEQQQQLRERISRLSDDNAFANVRIMGGKPRASCSASGHESSDALVREIEILQERLRRTEAENRGLSSLFLLQDEIAQYLTITLQHLRRTEGIQSETQGWPANQPVPTNLAELGAEERISFLEFLVAKLQKIDKGNDSLSSPLVINLDNVDSSASLWSSPRTARLVLPALRAAPKQQR